MDNAKVVLPKIVRKKSALLKFFLCSGIILLAASFFEPFQMGKWATMSILLVSVLMLNSYYVIKEYRIIGSVNLLSDRIIVNDNGRLNNYPLLDLSDIEVLLLEVKGEFHRGKAITTVTGSNNFIKFRYQGMVEEIMFLLEEQNSSNLAEVLQSWHQNNITFKLHNQTRKKFI